MTALPSSFRAACALALAILSTVAGTPAQAAGAAQGVLQVSAVVKRHTSVRMALPVRLTITPADLARGYVDVPAPVDVTVRSNVQDGYILVFERSGAQVRQARVQGAGGPVVVDGMAMAARPAGGIGMWQDALQLRFRFELAADATAGDYPWPLQVSMMSN